MTPDISIIVPFYNAEPYLRRCIESIQAQTLPNIEIIMVDDGSTDRSGVIAEEYAARDTRIRLLHQVNCGQSAADNRALDIAQGEYIGFVDADDSVEPEMYAALLAKARETQADMIVCGRSIYSESGVLEYTIIPTAYTITMGSYGIARYIFDFFFRPNTLIASNKLYSHRVINKYRLRYEDKSRVGTGDTLFNYEMLFHIETISSLDRAFYNTTERVGSEARTYHPGILRRIANLLTQCRDYAAAEKKPYVYNKVGPLFFLYLLQRIIQRIFTYSTGDPGETLREEFRQAFTQASFRVAAAQVIFTQAGEDAMRRLGFRWQGKLYYRCLLSLCLLHLYNMAASLALSVRLRLLSGEAIIYAFAYLIALAYSLSARYSHVWLIGERHDEARDNGYHLFKYIRTHHPDCNIYYVIRKGAKDLESIRRLGNVVYYGSLRHYVLYILADKLICAHQGSAIPDTPIDWRFAAAGTPRKRAYIKHGIIKENISTHYADHHPDFRLFVCGAKPEYEFTAAKYGYPEGTVQYLGLPRFDSLHDCTTKRRQLLLMPTWRQWFGMVEFGRDKETCRHFTESEYFLVYNNFINDPRLACALREHDLTLVFYPHHEMQDFIGAFSTTSDRVVFARENEHYIQQPLIESALLITDYSSVAFDFAYMRKPIIYYQFDEERYYSEHYARGYFEYGRDGFGPVAHTPDELIAQVRASIASDFTNPSCYLERVDGFFPLHDTDNCKRNYEAICNM